MNTFGKNLRLTTFGESHGVALGAVIDGCPSQIVLSVEDIQKELDRRKPGQSVITTQRKESDKAEILSGVFEGQTLGSPIAVIVRNQDHQSRDYEQIKNVYRPGHADEMWDSKFGIRDYRGGGRSSGRETLSRVIGGVIARKIIPETKIIGHTVQVENLKTVEFNAEVIESNPVRCADHKVAEEMKALINQARASGDSLGGVVEILIQNCPRNIGEPVFDKLSARLASALMSIGAVRSFEILPGKSVAQIRGSESNKFISGISGGISTGDDIVLRLSVKPTPSIAQKQEMKTAQGEIVEEIIQGRHDPCLLPRLIPVAEAMVALVIADLYLENKFSRC